MTDEEFERALLDAATKGDVENFCELSSGISTKDKRYAAVHICQRMFMDKPYIKYGRDNT